MMYWSVIGDRSHIEEAAMDGSMRRVLLDKKLRRPTGISMLLYVILTVFVGCINACEYAENVQDVCMYGWKE